MSINEMLIYGTILIAILITMAGVWKNVPIYKCIIIALAEMIVGTIGTVVMSYIETGHIGRSYYGAVFLIPLIMPLLAKPLKMKIGKVMDFSAIGAIFVLVIMKYGCYMNKCCGGKIIAYDQFGDEIFFPSQIVEGFMALLIGMMLLIILYRDMYSNRLYPLYMIAYGASRFVLNFFRKTKPFILFVTYGHLWSILSILIGIAWIYALEKRGLNNEK